MGLFDKLKNSLAKTKESVSSKIEDVIKAFRTVDEDLLEELEEALIMADLGVNTSCEIIEKLRQNAKEKKITDSNNRCRVIAAAGQKGGSFYFSLKFNRFLRC